MLSERREIHETAQSRRYRKTKVSNCKYCGISSEGIKNFGSHVATCKEKPAELRKRKPTGKKGENQYTKAKRLGLPKPEVSEETKRKCKETKRNRPPQKTAYYSKESQTIISKLISEINIAPDERIYFASKNREFCLCDGDNTFFYDLCMYDRKILVEYNGTRFHCKNTEDEWIPPFKSMGSKFDVFERDQTKKNLAISRGFRVFYIWSDDIEQGIKDIVECCSGNDLNNISEKL